MTPLELILPAMIVGLTVSGVLLMLRRTRFSAVGSVISLVVGILSISFGIALALALIFVRSNLDSEAVGGDQELGRSASYAISPTLGEKLFSGVTGRWDQEHRMELSKAINMRETIDGITVTVDRAYFDSNRIGVEYTVTGLPQSDSISQSPLQGSRVLEPETALMDAGNPGVRFRSASGRGVRADSQIKGMEVPPDTIKEVVGFDVTGHGRTLRVCDFCLSSRWPYSYRTVTCLCRSG